TIIESKFILFLRREKSGGDVRVMHVSDIHRAEKNSQIIKIAEENIPDVIFITGDLISRDETDFSMAESLLKRLCSIAPTYMVYGNHEQSLPEKQGVLFKNMITDTGVILLENEFKSVTVNEKILHIYGVIQKYSTYKKNGGYKNLDRFTLSDMRSAVGDAKKDGKIFLLAHNPKWAEVYAEWGADYTFCGHVHGGIIRIFGKGVFSPERKVFPQYSRGIYSVNRMRLCVSGGIGKLRLFNPPEVVIYEI
ncbi:MAG: metallophosphoesterase, partial [Ruminococcus sp.]|nr:metallophosphoesterase [Ruminococcus sp.]